MALFLTQTEETILNDLDRLVDWHRDNNKPLEHLTLSKRQYSTVKKIVDKNEADKGYSRRGALEINQNEYRGVPFNIAGIRRRNRRKKDTVDIFA